MSSPIDTLTSIVASETSPGSLYVYGVHNDNNYKIPLSNMRPIVGENVGALVIRSTDVALLEGEAWPWSGPAYDNGGWWDVASSTILRVPNGNISHVRLFTGWYLSSATNGGLRVKFMVNSDYTPQERSSFLWKNWTISRKGLVSTVIQCNSGDRFEVFSDYMTPSRTLAAGGWSFFAIQPVRFT